MRTSVMLAAAAAPALVIISLAVACALYWQWRQYSEDRFRHDVFRRRHELFMMAADGRIAFDHPAYTLLRFRMNLMLEYGHEFTVVRSLAPMFIRKRIQGLELTSPLQERWQRALLLLTDPIMVEELERLEREYLGAFGRHMLRTAPCTTIYLALRDTRALRRPADQVGQLRGPAVEEYASALTAAAAAAA